MNTILTGFPDGGTIYQTRTGLEWNWNPGEKIPLEPEPVIITGRVYGIISRK